jgi:hypothetical protein
LIPLDLKWHSTFYYLADSRPNKFKNGRRKMETLTDQEMLAIQGGDGWDSLGGALFVALMLLACA